MCNMPEKAGWSASTTYRTAPARFVKTDTMKPGYS
jgi:hypothetical protein